MQKCFEKRFFNKLILLRPTLEGYLIVVVVRLLLPVDELLPVQKLCMPSSHAVVSWREPSQGLSGDGDRLRRRVAASTSWHEAAAH